MCYQKLIGPPVTNPLLMLRKLFRYYVCSFYRIGPLHKGFDFVVRAEKEGYVMEKEDGELAVFRAKQLSRIDVKVSLSVGHSRL